MKPGVKTSEMWVAVGTSVFMLLQTYGLLNNEEAQAWQQVLVAFVAVLPSLAYIWSRTQLKKPQG